MSLLTDVFTPKKRSWVMSRIRSKNTKIDQKMQSLLSSIPVQFTMYPKLEGNPDFIIRNKKIAIFCDGDFWHGYTYMKGKKPHGKFWRNKISHNMKRDKIVTKRLRRQGWTVLRFWEHNIKKNPEMCLKRIIRSLE